MTGARILAAVLAFGAAAATTAQPGYWSSGTAASQFQISPWADADAYYYDIRYSGAVVPDFRIGPYGRSLDVRMGQAGGTPGGFFQNQMFQSYPIPADADVSRLTRRDEPGRTVLILPRRTAGGWPR